MKHQSRFALGLLAACLLAALVLAACSSPQTGGGGTAEVHFVSPEKYTDLQRSRETSEVTRQQVLPVLGRAIQEAAKRWLPGGVKLEVRILDINQAGYAYMGNPGPSRVERATDRTEVRLEYRLTQPGVQPGDFKAETLSDFYDSVRDSRRSGPMPVIQRLLEDWVRSVGKKL